MKKNWLVIGSFIAIVLIIVGIMATGNRKPEPLVTLEQSRPPVAATISEPSATSPSSETPLAQIQPKIQATAADVPLVEKAQAIPQRSRRLASSKDPILDPVARFSLSLVGADAEAEAYWTAAINDPNLPANERKDLIEDLNEDGLSDPKHPGPQDLPLILRRIQLIEDLSPFAMDQVNAKAFAEAHKDLVNLANGQPPQ